MISALLNLLYLEWYTRVQCVSRVAIFQVTDRFLSHFCCRYDFLIVDTTNGEDVGMVVTEYHNNCSRGGSDSVLYIDFL